MDSTPHVEEENYRSDAHLPRPDELGYALVRLRRPIGLEFPGGARGGKQRGWITLREDAPLPAPRSPVVIMCYTDHNPLKLAFDTQGMIGTNQNETRIRYTVETGPGASGGPCFDIDWNLFAMHQLRDPEAKECPPAFKQGIPTWQIRRRLRQRGKEDVLDLALE